MDVGYCVHLELVYHLAGVGLGLCVALGSGVLPSLIVVLHRCRSWSLCCNWPGVLLGFIVGIAFGVGVGGITTAGVGVAKDVGVTGV